jgi:prepilin-type N-terminal cleavage/methylation domain-containing protein
VIFSGAKPSVQVKLNRGFSLIEMAVALIVIALLLGSLFVPLQTQVEQRRIRETEASLAEIKDALIGYAAAGAPHLPCPDRRTPGPPGVANDGIEDVAAGGTCIVNQGNLPWVTLGVTETDSWGGRFLYRVVPAFGARPPSPTTMGFTTPSTLNVCQTSTCAPPVLTNDAPAVVVSLGKNRGNCAAPPCNDENANSDGDTPFVSRTITPAGAAAEEFDDLVVWISRNVLFNKLVAAEKLP